MRKPKKPKQAKPKAVAYELIDPTSVPGHPMYVLLTTLVSAHHPDLAGARIALAWCTSWNPDVDGRCTLGKMRRASDLDRELAQFDFIMLLRRSFWLDTRVTDEKRAALMDHELCHAAVKIDPRTNEPTIDERGRTVYRMRKHDLEEFSAIVERHGLWTSDLERFYAALRKHQEPFKACEQCQENPGWISSVDAGGVPRLSRCACWIRWSEHRAEVESEDAALQRKSA